MTDRYVLRLYVAGATPGSARAVEALRDLCDKHLRHRHELEIIDVYQQPQLALDEDIDAVPVLLKLSPLPIRRILGDLTDTEHVLQRLDLKPKPDGQKRRTTKSS